MGLGDTGHVGFLEVILILGTAGLIFGTTGGVVFACLFISLLPLLTLRLARVAVGAVLGGLSGLLGIYLADRLVGISNAFAVGSLAGSLTDLVCGALSFSRDDHHEIAAQHGLEAAAKSARLKP